MNLPVGLACKSSEMAPMHTVVRRLSHLCFLCKKIRFLKRHSLFMEWSCFQTTLDNWNTFSKQECPQSRVTHFSDVFDLLWPHQLSSLAHAIWMLGCHVFIVPLVNVTPSSVFKMFWWQRSTNVCYSANRTWKPQRLHHHFEMTTTHCLKVKCLANNQK